MSKVVRDETIMERRVQITMEHHELAQLIGDRAKADAGLLGDPNVSVKLEIEQEKEGSPSYTVSRWLARVHLVQGLEA